VGISLLFILGWFSLKSSQLHLRDTITVDPGSRAKQVWLAYCTSRLLVKSHRARLLQMVTTPNGCQSQQFCALHIRRALHFLQFVLMIYAGYFSFAEYHLL